MVGVVPGVTNGNVLEQMTVCSNKIVRLGPHLPSLLVNTPYSPVPIPGFVTREEVRGPDFENRGRHIHHDILLAVVPFQSGQVGVKVASQQQRCPKGDLYNG